MTHQRVAVALPYCDQTPTAVSWTWSNSRRPLFVQAVLTLAQRNGPDYDISTPLTVLPYITGRKTPGRRFSGLMMTLDCEPLPPTTTRSEEPGKAES